MSHFRLMADPYGPALAVNHTRKEPPVWSTD
jgi:hypothetical protein